MKRRLWVRGLAAAALVVALLLTLWASIAAGAWPTYHPLIVRGVRVWDEDLGDTPVDIAIGALHAANDFAPTVTLRIGVIHGPFRQSDLGLAIDAAATAQRALAIGRTGDWWTRIQERRQAARVGIAVAPVWRFDEPVAREFLSRMAATINRDAADAVLTLGDNGEFIRSEAQAGQRLDVERAVAMLREWAQSGRTADDPPPLPVATTPPGRTLDAYAGVEAEIARFHTEIGGSRDRVSNVTVAAQALNGQVIKPGEEFSFNAVVGPRTADRGFKEAPIIYAGKLVPGIGGGVCQASSTLFNAAAAGGMTILERHNHSHPVPYVLPGRDAAVSSSALNLRFRNDLGVPVAILTRVENLTLHIVIAGPAGRTAARLVTTTPRVKPAPVKEIPDPKLPAGKRVVVDEGQPSIFVITSRVWREGEIERTEELTRSYYPAKPRIIRVGTGPAPAAPAAEVPPPAPR